MEKKNAIKIPADGIIEISLGGNCSIIETNELILCLNNIEYARKTSNGNGLFRTCSGVDITVQPEYYELYSNSVVF